MPGEPCNRGRVQSGIIVSGHGAQAEMLPQQCPLKNLLKEPVTMFFFFFQGWKQHMGDFSHVEGISLMEGGAWESGAPSADEGWPRSQPTWAIQVEQPMRVEGRPGSAPPARRRAHTPYLAAAAPS